MILNKKLIVVMPAYNAEKTLIQTYEELHHEYVDEVILVDDASWDNTAAVAAKLGIKTIVHEKNKGYGANQKTCYAEALRHGGDIVVMLHPDYQYSPRLVTSMAFMLASGHYDIVLGSRILGGESLKGGMPLYKYIANRFLTLFQNMVLGVKLSEYHTGLRAFTREVLETITTSANSDDFIFDNEMLVQAVYKGYRIGEISCPTRYFPEASSINLRRSIKYGLGVLAVTMKYVLQKAGLKEFLIFRENKR
ncbi:MAG: glycosyltransferase family 2 protein [Nitrospirae bacterium]|nr:MAG: glycosyltransferase family 2 protein [Nitrospirota bacterium]